MTPMQKQALELSGTEEGASLRPSQKRLLETVTAIEAYLTKKYPDTSFEMDAYRPVGIMQPYDEFLLHPTDAIDDQFTLQAGWADDRRVLTDSYYGKLKVGEYEAYLAGILAKADVEAGVYSSIISMLPENFDASLPIEEAVKRPEFFSYSWIVLPPCGTAFDAKVEAVRKEVKSRKLYGEFTVYELLDPLPAGAGKEYVDTLIPSHTSEKPVYAQSYRFTNLAER